MRALIVDDEALVRGELTYTLRRVEPSIEIVEAATAVEALGELQQQRFDVVFLDVRMPGLSGLDAMPVIERLPHRPHVVIVSAHESHAVDAFVRDAIDYLLKPVSEQRLARTMERLRVAPSPERAEAERAASPTGGRLPVEIEGRTRLVRVGDIRFVKADDHVVSVMTYDEQLRYRGSLTECADRLASHHFLRVHRSFIVNPEHVVEISPFFGGTYVLRVGDRARSEVPVSRSYVRSMREALGV